MKGWTCFAIGLPWLFAGCGPGAEPAGPSQPLDAAVDAIVVDAGQDSSDTSDSADGSDDAALDPCIVSDFQDLSLAEAATGLLQPVFATSDPRDSSRLFVMERAGVVKLVASGQTSTYLDFSHRVSSSTGRGAFSMAFSPRFGVGDDRFWVYYIDLSGRSVVSSFSQSPSDPTSADSMESVLFRVPQSDTAQHYGGMIAFGPDGYLYVSLGDGGPGQNANGQDLSVPQGKLLRVDVDGYPTPVPGNLAGTGEYPHGLHFGLRNPWRWSFDRLTHDLYIADVGAVGFEEINAVRFDGMRHNFGWPVMEGAHCRQNNCDPTGFTLPIDEYPHAPTQTSVTGGYVYRGARVPMLQGRYLYGDLYSGRVTSIAIDGLRVCQKTDVLTDRQDDLVGIVSFGEDADGEVYIVNLLSGTVWKIVAT